MKYLQKLAGGTDTTLALHALLRQPELWIDNTITLRDKVDGKYVNWFTFDLLPQFRQFIFGLMGRVEGEQLGKVCLFRVTPGISLPVVKDKFDCYFLCINVIPGVSLSVEDEGIMLLAGDAWWSAEDGIFTNNSADDFIFLQLEIAASSPATYVPEPKL
jgi:hypothetical protein